jgi:Spy/CpxP family protein refolding chaperone
VKPWKVILAAIVIFAAGAMVGTALTRKAPRAGGPRAANTNVVSIPPAPPNFMAQRLEFLRLAERQLELTPEQRAKVEQIMNDSRQRTRQIMEKLTPELREELKQTTLAIRETLSREQREKFDRLMRNRAQQQFQKRDEKRPPGDERRKKGSSTNGQAFGQTGE